MSKFKIWQRWGLTGVVLNLMLALGLYMLDRIHWWYSDTIWYRLLRVIDYPPGRIERAFLNWIQVPRIYDVPLTLREAAIIYSTGYLLGCAWWFLLGALGSVAWVWLGKHLKPRHAAAPMK